MKNQIVMTPTHTTYAGPIAARWLKHYDVPTFDPIPSIGNPFIVMQENAYGAWKIISGGHSRDAVKDKWVAGTVLIDRAAVVRSWTQPAEVKA